MSTQLSVIKNATPSATLVKAGTLKNRLTRISANSRDNTLSLAYYTMVNGNVNPMASCDSQLSTLLDPKYRHMVCAKFDKNSNTWVYAKPKATKLLKELHLEFNKATFAEFVEAVENHMDTIAAKKADKEEQEKALDPQQKVDAEKEKVMRYLVNCNLDAQQLASLVASVEIERSRKNSKTGKTTSKAVVVNASDF